MLERHFQKQLQKHLSKAGISFNGSHPHDIQVKNDQLYHRLITQGSLGFGEAYMDGWWDCASLDTLTCKLLQARINKTITSPFLMLDAVLGRIFNLQSGKRTYTVGNNHYNTGNDLFQAMLDPLMLYSCASWNNADTLQQAQKNKLRLIFDKLQLKPGMHLLDIGCGWGGAAKFAAEEYGVEVTGITISSEQADLAKHMCKGLPVSIQLQDYRTLEGRFDRIYSIGMFEHVGHKNYSTYFQTANRLLAPGGLFLLHTIGGNQPATSTDPWISRYIFPNSMIPSASQVTIAMEPYVLLNNWHVLIGDYDRTLLAWHNNIEQHWHTLPQHKYPQRFQRMWRYYLLTCAGAFRARHLQVWQLLLEKRGRPLYFSDTGDRGER
ncbi:cyclopropane fatty acyl phospholipid synthase [Prosthecochloris vibrioformis]|uniref:Cyclopropane fatty acyl phospholipid synthase n=1 Tax=Prosthecochloris vibrioformis TaxID=1098 RepID=A0A5C4S294_PROVB|nr:cyclopropane fatty acyl phospholipid synthase [Prosthecochloris vibrioformis]TNJ36861.1 cyclopropane fatty acyl phospholipid synthase [Prosthecochloris vibrioformis]